MPGNPATIRDPKRVAADTIRGFLAQVLLSCHRWLDLDDNAVLVVEGNEDIDVQLFQGERLLSATEESVKALAGKVSARNEAIYETFANFCAAYHHFNTQGTACTLVFTTTAARADQDTSDRFKPVLDFDLLREWGLFSEGNSTRNAAEIFDGVAAVVREKLKPSKPEQPSKVPEDAIAYVADGRQADFLRSVRWNFGGAGVAVLQDQLLSQLTSLEDGNSSRAHAVADRMAKVVWEASASNTLTNRVLTRSSLDKLRADVETRHKAWKSWEEMLDFTSWITWEADHYTVAAWSEGGRSSVLAAVCFKPTQAEAALRAAWDSVSTEPVVLAAAKEALQSGEFLRAFWLDDVVRTRVLDALRTTGLQIYAVVREQDLSDDLVREPVQQRARRPDRIPADIAGEPGLVERTDLAVEVADRPSLVQTLTVIAAAFGKWRFEGVTDQVVCRTVTWTRPFVKVLRTEDGQFHRVDSDVWDEATP